MTVQAIRLQNFMAFQDTDWIELRPICLLFGRNSSGKSTLIRALRLLKQSLNSLPEEGALRFVVEGGLEQGRFHNTIHHSASSNLITFGFRCDFTHQLETVRKAISVSAPEDASPQLDSELDQQTELWLSFAWNKDESRVELAQLRVALASEASRNEAERVLFEAERPDRELDVPVVEKHDKWAQALGRDVERVEWELTPVLLADADDEDDDEWLPFTLELKRGFLPDLVPVSATAPAPPKGSAPALVQELLGLLGGTIRTFLEKLEYIGPLRPEPQRVYRFDDLVRQRWRAVGLSAFLQFVEDKGDSLQLVEQMSYWLQQLGLAQEVKSDPDEPKEGGRLSAIHLWEAKGEKWLSLKDVGFGTSQVLPIIVQCLLTKPGQMVIIEQPELHLHPGAQAQLADRFIQVAHQGVRLLVETHSEHIFLRLRRRAAESSTGKMKPESPQFLEYRNLSVLFVDRDHEKGASTAEPIVVRAKGEINAPKGFRNFFSDDLTETAFLTAVRLGLPVPDVEE